MSYSEIAQVLGVPRNTAKTWGHRARGLLCEALEGVM
jgi:DNA-directed RNA polymerase specialized sigma24 family protein